MIVLVIKARLGLVNPLACCPGMSMIAAGGSYRNLCGRMNVWGDGIVPLPSAHLPGEDRGDRSMSLLWLIPTSISLFIYINQRNGAGFVFFFSLPFDLFSPGAINITVDGVHHLPSRSRPRQTAGAKRNNGTVGHSIETRTTRMIYVCVSFMICIHLTSTGLDLRVCSRP